MTPSMFKNIIEMMAAGHSREESVSAVLGKRPDGEVFPE